MNTETNLFVIASRKKYRFKSGRGQLTTEALWELDLEDLNTIAITLDDESEKEGKKSFIKKRNVKSKELSNKLDIVKYIIEVKMNESEVRKTRAVNNQQKQLLESLLEKKKMEELENLSPDQIEEKLKELNKA